MQSEKTVGDYQGCERRTWKGGGHGRAEGTVSRCRTPSDRTKGSTIVHTASGGQFRRMSQSIFGSRPRGRMRKAFSPRPMMLRAREEASRSV